MPVPATTDVTRPAPATASCQRRTTASHDATGSTRCSPTSNRVLPLRHPGTVPTVLVALGPGTSLPEAGAPRELHPKSPPLPPRTKESWCGRLHARSPCGSQACQPSRERLLTPELRYGNVLADELGVGGRRTGGHQDVEPRPATGWPVLPVGGISGVIYNGEQNVVESHLVLNKRSRRPFVTRPRNTDAVPQRRWSPNLASRAIPRTELPFGTGSGVARSTCRRALIGDRRPVTAGSSTCVARISPFIKTTETSIEGVHFGPTATGDKPALSTRAAAFGARSACRTAHPVFRDIAVGRSGCCGRPQVALLAIASTARRDRPAVVGLPRRRQSG